MRSIVMICCVSEWENMRVCDQVCRLEELTTRTHTNTLWYALLRLALWMHLSGGLTESDSRKRSTQNSKCYRKKYLLFLYACMHVVYCLSCLCDFFWICCVCVYVWMWMYFCFLLLVFIGFGPAENTPANIQIR